MALGALLAPRSGPGERASAHVLPEGPRADATWLVPLGATVLLLSALPALVAMRFGPSDLERLGTFWFVRDFTQYQAAMREGASSTSWLMHDRFTAEPHGPVLMYPLYVALGKLARWAALDPLGVFSAAEWLGRLALLAALAVFGRTFLDHGRVRRLALLLTLGTLGFAGWAVPFSLLRQVLTPGDAPAFSRAINVYLEISSFGVLLSAPHLMLGLALTLLAAPLYLRARTGSPGWVALLALDLLTLSFVHPFNLPVVCSVLLADGALAWRARPPRRAPIVAALAACLAAAPMAVYQAALFQMDPFWSGTYGAQNRMPAPAPWELPGDFGLVLLAAPLAWGALRRWRPERRTFLLLWIGLGFAWLYMPVPYQRRFAFGTQPALALLAAVGLVQLNVWMRHRGWGGIRRRMANYALALAALVTSVLVYVSLLVSAVTNQPSEVYPWSSAEAQAARWLAGQTDERDVVLASTPFANALVGAIDGRVVSGHVVATRESARKAALVERFYAADTSPSERRDLLRESGATVVALGPRERGLGVADLSDQPSLRLMYDERGVRWYRVERES